MNNVITKIRIMASNPGFCQFFKYSFVGFLNTGIYYGIYYIMLKFGFLYVIAAAAGTIAGIINSFFWNKYFTFRSKKKSISETLKFLLVYAVQYVCNIFIIFLCVNYFGITAELAGLVAISISVFLGFFGHKFWSFQS